MCYVETNWSLFWNNFKIIKYYQIMHHLYQVTKTENLINLFLKFQEAQQKEQKVSIEGVWIWANEYCIFIGMWKH